MKAADKLKIQSSVLKMVREISKAAFDKRMQSNALNFDCWHGCDVVSIHLDGHPCVFDSSFSVDKVASFQSSFPRTVIDISRFEGEVNLALVNIFNYVEAKS